MTVDVPMFQPVDRTGLNSSVPDPRQKRVLPQYFCNLVGRSTSLFPFPPKKQGLVVER